MDRSSEFHRGAWLRRASFIDDWDAARRAAMTVAAIFLIAAQTPPGSNQDREEGIVVTGIALSKEEARQQATTFVRSTGVAQGETPAARWVEPVCPKVLGLTDAGGRAAEARMREIAGQAGIEVARAPCDGNVVVSFAPDPVAVLQQVAARAPRRLSEVSRPEREVLITGSAPVRWWYSTEVLGRFGQRARNLPPPRTESDGSPSPSGSAIPDVPTMMHYESSTISTLANRAIISASVVIDEKAVLGMSLDAIVAYAALVGFAEIRNSGARPHGSILGLFEMSDPPRDLTAQDRAFLRALYRIPLDRPAIRHRGSLVNEMTAALARDD